MESPDFFDEAYLKTLFEKLKKSNSKGIDKQSITDFEKHINQSISTISRKVKSGTYDFTPYLELLKLKGRNKIPRIISIPTIRDKIVLLALKELLHHHFNESVNRKLPNNYIKDINNYLKKNAHGPIHYLKLDIEKFYDTIDRDKLITKLKDKEIPENIIELIKLAISTITIPQNTKRTNYRLYYHKHGVPQGLSISNILAQIYLLHFDVKVSKRGYFFTRYVDDILLLNNYAFSEIRIKNFQKEIENLGLRINQEKTEQNQLSDKPFIFLSYLISDSSISISDKNVELFIRRIASKVTWFKQGIKNKKSRPLWLQNNDERFKEVFIEELNEIITGVISKNKNYGWLFYFSEMNDLQLLFRLDKIIGNFFLKLEKFENSTPSTLKKLTKAFYSIKFDNQKKYICNFDVYNSLRRKREFLVFRGIISSEKDYAADFIESVFDKHISKQKRRVQQDLGYTYF